MLACLENIVGITNTDCDCITNGLSEEEIAALAVSVSGLYVEDLPGGIQLKTIKGVDACKNFAQLSLGARDRAIQTLQDDLIVAMGNRYEKSAKPYKGSIGKASYAVTLSDARQFQGVRIRPRNHTDATFVLKRFQLIGNASVDLDVYIVRTEEGNDGQGGEVVFTTPLSTIANNFVAFTLPDGGLTLPFREDDTVFEYWLYFDKGVTAFLPKDTKISGTCSKCSNDVWHDYLQVDGIGFTDPTNMLGTGSTDGYSHGFVLDVEIKCESKPLICREYNETEKISVAMAWAANFKTGEYVIEEVLKSAEVNRYTLQAKEYNWGKRNHFRAEYDARVKFIAAEMNPNNSDCFMCKERELFFTKISG